MPFILTGCASTQVIPVDDPLAILEVTPLPKDVKIDKAVLYEPVYGIMRILEISVVNGVQVELLAKQGDVKTGLSRGVVGEISDSSSFGEIIGTVKIVSVSNGFVTCKVDSVTKKIPNNSFVRVVVGQKIKE